MPYVSDQQRKFMHARHPKIAKRWDKETPKGESLPKYSDSKEKSAAFLLGKQAGMFDAIGSKVVAPAMQGGAKLLSKGLGAVGLHGAEGSVGRYASGLGESVQHAGMSDANIAGKFNNMWGPHTDEATKELEGLRSAAGDRVNTLGMAGTAAVGIPALMGVSRMIGNSRRKREEEAMAGGGKQASAQLGTPVTDGILAYCAQQGFTDEQIAAVFEKGAEVEGGLGDECREFLERLTKA